MNLSNTKGYVLALVAVVMGINSQVVKADVNVSVDGDRACVSVPLEIDVDGESPTCSEKGAATDYCIRDLKDACNPGELVKDSATISFTEVFMEGKKYYEATCKAKCRFTIISCND